MKRVLFIFLILVLLCLSAGCNRQPAVTEETTLAPTQAPVSTQFCARELQKYTIVYGSDNPDYFDLAYRLSDRIYTQYGVLLTAVSDVNSVPTQYEILLGDTNRYNDASRIMEYAVTVDEGTFRIHAGGSFSAEKAVDFLCEQVFTGQDFTFDDGTYYQTSFLTTSQPVTDGASARIMSANVLADAFADASFRKAHYRAELFAGMLISYTPDVVGLQETDESWNAVLDAYLAKLQSTYAITYSRLLPACEEKVNYTSLLYRSDKFQVKTSDMHVFSWWNNEAFHHNYHMRNISWAEFSALDNAEQSFLVANTHWSYRTEHADGNTTLAGAGVPIETDELRLQCKDETNTYMSQLRQNYPDTPIFLTGDFNTSLPFFTESGWTPNGFRIISQEALDNGTALSLVPSSGHFDHLFGCGNYSVDYYTFFNDVNYHSLLTDHPFVYADFTF